MSPGVRYLRLRPAGFKPSHKEQIAGQIELGFTMRHRESFPVGLVCSTAVNGYEPLVLGAPGGN